MKKIALPLVMIASLATLASCTYGDKENMDSSRAPSPVSGKVRNENRPTEDRRREHMPMNQSGMMMEHSGSMMEHSGAMMNQSGTMMMAHPLTRTEVVSYDSKTPEGMVQVEFSVTTDKDGIITSATATPKTDKKGSLYNQENFVKGLSAAVVGKKAKDLHVDAIGGASLTTAAFEEYVHSM